MTYKEWERRLLKNLKILPKTERRSIADYYREMYGDKCDLGLSCEEILQEFGAPEACATKILSEEREEPSPSKNNRTKRKNGVSVAYIVGIVFASLIVIAPLACVWAALVASFGAVTLSGAIFVLAGIAYTVLAPLMLSSGVGVAAITAHIGTGIALCGIGLILFVGFMLLTKYTAIGLGKALTFIYGRRKEQ